MLTGHKSSTRRVPAEVPRGFPVAGGPGKQVDRERQEKGVLQEAEQFAQQHPGEALHLQDPEKAEGDLIPSGPKEDFSNGGDTSLGPSPSLCPLLKAAGPDQAQSFGCSIEGGQNKHPLLKVTQLQDLLLPWIVLGFLLQAQCLIFLRNHLHD